MWHVQRHQVGDCAGAAHFGLPGLALLQCLLASAGQHEAASADRRRVQMVPPQAGRLHGVLLQRAAFIAVGRSLPTRRCCAWYRELGTHCQIPAGQCD